MQALPKKQATAEQLKKSNRFVLKITAVVLAVVIFLGAVAGLIVGLVLRNKDDGAQNDEDKTQTEPPADTVEIEFACPVKSFYSAEKYFINPVTQRIDNYRTLLFEVEKGEEIYAVADGIVISNIISIEIDHGNGIKSICTYFSSIITEAMVEVDSEVKKGQLLCKTSFNYVALNVLLNGEYVDPLEYLTELPEPATRPPAHVHEWGEWQTSIDSHWKSCECGEDTQSGEHEFDGDKCTVCGYEKPAEKEEPDFGLPMQTEIYRFYGEEVIDSFGDPGRHTGVDFSAQTGDNVYAVADGVIVKIYKRTSSNCFIKIDHGNGIICMYYGAIAVDNLKEGNSVKKGELIVTVSEDPYFSEEDDDVHLHFTMTVNDVNVDPLDYITY